jgi:methylglutaconyl-CoA hydratase
MSDGLVLYENNSGVATLTLNRAELHNALDERVIKELTGRVRAAGDDPSVRVIVLAAAGTSFSAGADLNYMRRMAGFSDIENRADADQFANLLDALHSSPKPTIARVQGAAVGGGVGLVAACDIAIASAEAFFRLTEVRLGLVAALISPYLVEAIGPRTARRYMLTSERIDALAAMNCGLVHEVVAAGELDATVLRFAAQLARGGPQALAESKKLVGDVSGSPINETVRSRTAEVIAARRASDEARSGIRAYFDKKTPPWQD